MIFGKRSAPENDSGQSGAVETHFQSQVAADGVEGEYEELVKTQLAKLGIPLESVVVEVHSAGAAQDGRNVYLGMLRLTKWERRTSLRLLVAIPLLEAKTRQALRTMWLTDVSHFGGLWFHASSALRSTEVLHETHRAILQLELGDEPPAGSGSRDGSWSASVPASLDALEGVPSRRP